MLSGGFPEDAGQRYVWVLQGLGHVRWIEFGPEFRLFRHRNYTVKKMRCLINNVFQSQAWLEEKHLYQ